MTPCAFDSRSLRVIDDPVACTRFGCGRPVSTTVIIYGCVVEVCWPCAVEMCDPIGAGLEGVRVVEEPAWKAGAVDAVASSSLVPSA